MVQIQLSLDNKQYNYLQRRAQEKGAAIESLLFEMIQAEMVWQQTLASDSVLPLIGQVQDDFDVRQIDDVVYSSK